LLDIFNGFRSQLRVAVLIAHHLIGDCSKHAVAIRFDFNQL
jgi:hypothetical protein